ncbi:glycosyltransferase [Filimonas effusa]|uniref:Glycosyltransferase n=2 Tax=Filimonas effusa TaxID=2508721 RepID=A0A4Q1DD88_9BACT|nr:glycosyltransferase [Filimonas effusa]
MPKISIISPSYNQAAFIEDAILSVLNQNYENFEHIIIDGGSTDDTVNILKKYPHLIWVSEKDRGQSDAINKGFDRASGDIIGWLNTDDFYLPGTFNKIVDQFKANNIDVVYGDIHFVDKNKNITRHVPSRVPVKWFMLFHCYIHSASFFFRRSVLDKGIRIDPGMHITMDKDFFAHIFYSGFKFKYVRDTLTAFRWHEDNKSIDTAAVKKIRYREGLIIFNKYSGIRLPVNSVSINLYAFVQKSLYPFKRFLKWYSLYKTR